MGMHSRGTKLLQGVLHCMLLFKGVCEGLKCCFCRVKAEGGGKGGAADSTQSPTAAWQALMAAQCPGGREPRLLGPRLFGLDNATVAALVRALPHAARCARFEGWTGQRPEAEPMVRRSWVEFCGGSPSRALDLLALMFTCE